MWHSLKNIFHFLIIFQSLIFIVFILTQKTRNKPRNIILMMFLGSIILVEMTGVVVHFLELKEIIIIHFPQFYYLIYPFQYAYAPLMFLYILSFIKPNFKINKTAFLHFTPLLLMCILFLIKYVIYGSFTEGSSMENTSFFHDSEDRVYDYIEFIQFFSYGVASLFVLKNYGIQIKNHFSSTERINLSWLKFVVLGIICWKFFRFTDLILWIYFQASIPKTVNIVLYFFAEILFLFFLSAMFLKGFKQPSIFSVNHQSTLKPKYEKILLSEEKMNDYRNRLLEYMKIQKPYLNPSLSLQELSEKLSIPSHHLSQVLNTSLNQKFFDFVNYYRIEESKRILKDDNANQKTILEVLYENGFNSKSVFNIAFKKHTGMTPTEFRNINNPSNN